MSVECSVITAVRSPSNRSKAKTLSPQAALRPPPPGKLVPSFTHSSVFLIRLSPTNKNNEKQE